MNFNTETIVSLILTVILVIVTRYVVPYLKMRLEQADQEDLIVLIENLVKAAEQIYQGIGRGAEKKEYVLQALAEKGIANTQTIDCMIESAVYDLGGKKDERN